MTKTAYALFFDEFVEHQQLDPDDRFWDEDSKTAFDKAYRLFIAGQNTSKEEDRRYLDG